MFKEFAVIFIIFIIVAFIFRVIRCRNTNLFQRIALASLICGILVNTFYNVTHVFPTFVYEGVPIGDSVENLFVYKKDSEFQWQILNTIVNGRKVLMDKENSLYQRYFEIFADEYNYIDIEESVQNSICYAKEDFEDAITLSMLEQLDYAFLPPIEKKETLLYIEMEHLKGCDSVVALTDSENNLYIISQDYYNRIFELENDD